MLQKTQPDYRSQINQAIARIANSNVHHELVNTLSKIAQIEERLDASHVDATLARRREQFYDFLISKARTETGIRNWGSWLGKYASIFYTQLSEVAYRYYPAAVTLNVRYHEQLREILEEITSQIGKCQELCPVADPRQFAILHEVMAMILSEIDAIKTNKSFHFYDMNMRILSAVLMSVEEWLDECHDGLFVDRCESISSRLYGVFARLRYERAEGVVYQ